MMKILLTIALILVSFCLHAREPWTDWEQFKRVYISPEGRVIDGSSEQLITTSEGQSYALLCALIANDKETFERVLNWTETNLAHGDLTAQLPAWQWGMTHDDNQYGILDENSASDADLWMAYALAEAGRLWGEYRYQSISYFLAQRILNEEAINISNYGWMILPGKKGFQVNEHTWRLNPSYLPIQIFRRFAVLYPHSPWQEITQNTVKFLKQSMQQGFSPDWATLTDNNQVAPDIKDEKIGGYNAIRVYLWLGMLSNAETYKADLMMSFSPMLKIIQTDGFIAEQYNIKTNTQVGYKPLGFMAAVLPFLISANNPTLANEFLEKLKTREISEKSNHYYDSILILIGKSWLEKRYQFDETGKIII